MKKIILSIGITILIQLPMNAQNLEGKWLAVNEASIYTEPNIYILEITSNNFLHFDFGELLFEEKYLKMDSIILIDNVKRYSFRFLDSNILAFDFFDELGKQLVFSLNFVRLNNYENKNYNINNIVDFKFYYKDENFRNLISFNKILDESETFDLGNHQVGNNIKLEKFHDIFFIVIYFDQYRQKAIPIKSYEENELILYGFDYQNSTNEFSFIQVK